MWNRSGNELYYMGTDGGIYAVDMRGATGSGKGPVSLRLFQAGPATGPVNAALSGAPYLTDFDTIDGKQFLVSCRAEAKGQFTVMTNWLSQAALRPR